jgi:uncharacterized protein
MLPKKLRDLVAYVNGAQFLGDVASLTPPVLKRKTEEYEGGGMAAPLDLAYGLEKMTAEMEIKGHNVQAFREFGVFGVAGVLIRFVGAHQQDDSGEVDTVEFTMAGMHTEVNAGEGKKNEAGSTKTTTTISYLKYVVNGVTEVEIDVLNGIEAYRGVDRNAPLRDALGI